MHDIAIDLNDQLQNNCRAWLVGFSYSLAANFMFHLCADGKSRPCSQKLQLGGSFVQNCGPF